MPPGRPPESWTKLFQPDLPAAEAPRFWPFTVTLKPRSVSRSLPGGSRSATVPEQFDDRSPADTTPSGQTQAERRAPETAASDTTSGTVPHTASNTVGRPRAAKRHPVPNQSPAERHGPPAIWRRDAAAGNLRHRAGRRAYPERHPGRGHQRRPRRRPRHGRQLASGRGSGGSGRHRPPCCNQWHSRQLQSMLPLSPAARRRRCRGRLRRSSFSSSPPIADGSGADGPPPH